MKKSNKLDVQAIISSLKEGVKQVKVEKGKTVLFNPSIKPSGTKIRDMRQEAMDLGSHGSDVFKEGQV